MKVLHLLWTCDFGGIEKLCLDIGKVKIKSHEFCVIHAGGSMYEKMQSMGIKISCLSCASKELFKVYKILSKKIAEEQITDVFLHHDAPILWIVGSILKITNPELHIYVYAHGDYNDFTDGRMVKKVLFSIACRQSDTVVAISNSVKKSILKNTNINASKISVVYNGVDVENLKCIRNEQFVEPLKFVFVGRLIPEKGVQVLLKAISIICHKILIEGEIVGDGPYMAELQRQCHELGVERCVHFVGKSMDIKSHLQKADVFIHPAIWEEGFGITIVEAMASGLPCIAFRKGAIPEIITDETDGFLVDEDTADKLADRILDVRRIISSIEFSEIRRKAAAKAERFSINQMVFGLDKIMEESRIEL